MPPRKGDVTHVVRLHQLGEGGSRRRIGPWLLAAALAAIIVGAVFGDIDADLLLKARILCIECIGIG